MVHHSLRTNPYKMFIFQRSVTCSFCQELYSHIDKNSGEKFEDMLVVKIASKGTSLNKKKLIAHHNLETKTKIFKAIDLKVEGN